MPEDSLIYQETAQREQQELRAELANQLKAKDQQLALLDRQVAALKKQVGSANTTTAVAQNAGAELATLQQLLKSVHNDRASVERKLSTIPRLRTPALSMPKASPTAAGGGTKFDDMDFGRYYALVIGNGTTRY